MRFDDTKEEENYELYCMLKEDFASGITTLELENFISLIDVFSDVFRRGTANHLPMTSP